MNLKGASPQHQFSLRSDMDLGRTLELNLWLRYVDSLPGIDVDHYTALDACLCWKPVSNLEFSIIGQNLVDRHHMEFEPEIFLTEPTEVERSIYVKAIISF